MVITLNNTSTLSAGTGLTLTCTVTLDPNVNNNERVVVEWSRVPEGRSTVSPVVRGSGSSYTGSLTISPLADQDDGTYTCTVTVTGGMFVRKTTTTVSYNVSTISK